MTGTVLAWHDGRPQNLSSTDWAALCASFLGSGFRVDLPSGPERAEASDYERGRALEVADLIGASLSERDWNSAAASNLDDHVELVGGWPRVYAGASAMWVTAVPILDDSIIKTAALLPSIAHPRPTSDLPMFSRLADEVALKSIDADCGIWTETGGRVVTSTAGPILAQRVDGSWATGSETGTWLGRRVIQERSATNDLRAEELESALFVGLIRRARAVLPLTYMGPGPIT